jgi:hypothetical protein
MSEHYDLTLLYPDNNLGRDIAIMRADYRGASREARPDASCDRPRGIRDHLLDFGDPHNPQLVVFGALMDRWARVVSAVTVGLVARLSG